MNPEDYFLELDSSDLGGGWGGPLMKISWNADIRNALTKIEANSVGLLLLREFQRYKLWVRIKPYSFPDASDEKRYCNAETEPHFAATTPIRTDGAIVKASLERFADGSVCAKRAAKQGGAVAEPHEQLFHELVHAFRWSTGTAGIKRLGGGLKGYKGVEEFIAIMVTNIYASAGGKDVLRADWRSARQLGGAFDGSLEYFRQSSMTYPIVADFYAANKVFCLLLANIKVPFNPIRAFVKDAEKARRYAEGATAKHRDQNLPTSKLIYDP